jgi:hypothetical protein
MFRADDPNVGIDRHQRPGFRRAMAVDVDLAGQDQRACLLARLDEAFLDEQRIEALLPTSFAQ